MVLDGHEVKILNYWGQHVFIDCLGFFKIVE